MRRSLPVRQITRRSLIFAMFLLFPVLLNYMSPYLIIDGAFQGILSGSAVLFSLLFVSSLLVGRAWCGWLCPGGGLQDAALFISDKKVSQKGNWIKWLVWVPWIAIIVFGFISAGGLRQVNVLHMNEKVVSLVEYNNYAIYYIVITLIFVLSQTVGSRAFCHYGCWMAPYMIIGRKLRNLAAWPSLRLQVRPENCADCKQCVRNCPMSLDVNALVQTGSMEHSECILCGNCVDTCQKGVIRYSFSAGK